MLTKTKAAAKGSRGNELKKILEDRRRELMHEVHGKIRDARADGTKEREVLDQGESSEVDIQDEIEFALLQMKAETLKKIDFSRLFVRLFRLASPLGTEAAEADPVAVSAAGRI